MTRRNILLALGLLVAGWLAFFTEKAPDSDIAQPTARSAKGGRATSGAAQAKPAAPKDGTAAGAARTTVAAGPGIAPGGAAAGKEKPEVMILPLLPRGELLGQSADLQEADKPAAAGNSTNSLPSKLTGKPASKMATKLATKLEGKPAGSPAGGVAMSAAKPGMQPLPGSKPGMAPPTPMQETKLGGLFSSHSWTPPPPPPPPPPSNVPPPPPMAPPLPFTYLGKKGEDNVWEVYLARGSDIFILQDKTVVEGKYRVDSIKPPTLTLTYLPLNQVQTLIIGGTD